MSKVAFAKIRILKEKREFEVSLPIDKEMDLIFVINRKEKLEKLKKIA